MHILQALFAALLLLQTTDASLIQLSRDRRSIKVLNIRLAGNGSTSSRGRVEVASSNGTWGTISQINFDSNDAVVICRMLGFNTGRVITYYNAYFGLGSGPVWLNHLGCLGNETHLDQCQSDSSPFGHYYDAGVACGIGVVIQNVSLVGRRGTHEGTVQILGPDGMWGTLTSLIDGNAAKVICRTLGFETTGDVSVFNDAHFGQGSGPMYYITKFGCTGQEASITDCDTSDIIINANVEHRYDTGVSCNKATSLYYNIYYTLRSCIGFYILHLPLVPVDRNEHDIRLVGGNTTLEGRVEVYHKGVWGTVCDNGFDSREAEVICYMLGYDTSSVHLYKYNPYGDGTGQIWLNNLTCNGTESKLDECPSLTWGTSSCAHNQDVGIDCHQSVGLYGGRYPSEGYVHIGNDWKKTICGINADGNLARVVCRSLGYNTYYGNPAFYSLMGYATVSNVTIKCARGTETNLAECKQGSSTYCNSNTGLYVNCTGSLNGRLVGGAHNWEGKLLIQNNMDFNWYRVCTDVWTDREATLFCQLISNNMKGNVYGRVIRNTAFDQQPGSFIFLSTRCYDRSQLCIFEVNNTDSCPYTDIAMSCTHTEKDSQHSVRLVGGKAEYEGRIEINLSNQSYTLCDAGWDQQDAIVVCRSLGYWVSSPRAFSDAWFGQGSVPSSNVNPYCHGNELSIFECLTSYIWGSYSCSHSEDAAVRCNSVSLGRDKIRLAYGPGPWKGKLEVFYNDHWGGVCMKSWNQRNTDVVCRMMSYNSAIPNYYTFNGTSTTILIGDIQCRGNETDIGLCKAFLDKSNCTDEVVGIDCSDGMQARLTGGNSSMGYAQLQENGSWKQICSSGWNNEEAAVFCRTLGFSVAVATTNVTLSNGVSASDYRSIDCSGWEDHINQCRLQNPPVNCGYATVNCLKCFYEYTSNTGTVVSPNYPSSYPPNWSCLYNIRPFGPSRSSLYKLNFDLMGLGNEGDEVQVRDGFPGTTRLYTWNGHVDTPSNIGHIIAKEFSILFRSDSFTEHPGFRAQWTPLVLEDALTAGCLSSGWNIKINTTILRMLYPNANASDIYMTVRSCKGKVVDDGLQFLHPYSGCNTLTQISSNEIIYTNQLIQPNVDPNFPFIVFNHMWRVETRCSVPLPDQNSSVGIHPVEGNAGSFIDNGHHNLTSSSQGVRFEYHFYTDPAFYNEISNAYVPFGHELYVKVVYPSQNSNVKMKVDTCTVFDSTSPSHSFTLIKDGCPASAMVHLILTQQHETRFSYQVFEFQDSSHDLMVNCNVAICAYNDNSHRCTQGCSTKRAMVLSQESDPNATYQVESRTMIVKLDVPDAVLSSGTHDLWRDIEDFPLDTNHKP